MLGTNTSTRGRTRSRNAFQSTLPRLAGGIGQAQVQRRERAPAAGALEEARQPRAAVGEDAPHQGRVAEVEDAGAFEHRVLDVLSRRRCRSPPGSGRRSGRCPEGSAPRCTSVVSPGHHADPAREFPAVARHPLEDQGSERVVADPGHEPGGHAEAVQAESRVGHRAARADRRRPDVEEPARAEPVDRGGAPERPAETGDDVDAEVAAGHDRAVTVSCRHRRRV